MRKVALCLVLGLCILSAAALAGEGRLLRFPDVTKDKIVFSYAGDIYTVPRAGGTAMRLTSDEGLELFAKFSPDGKMIAFTGQYDGDLQVYVMPAAGGEPKRLTYHPGLQHMAERMGPENIVLGWHPDGKSVLFRSRRDVGQGWDGRAYLVKLDGGMPEPLPMALAGFTSFSPDAKKVAYCPIFRDFRTWKRYKGGMAQDVWIFDLQTFQSQKITDWDGTDNMPMWYQDKIYFNSDRTGTLNLYCYDIASAKTRQVTQFNEYDVRWPSLGPDGIAFENGGYVYVMDLPSETVHKVPIELNADLPQMRPEYVKISDRISEFDIAPDGKRAVFSARNEIVTVPAKEGNTRNLTNTSGACEKEPAWSPDSKWIAYISDETGEEEIYIISQDGKEKIQLTTDGHCRRYNLSWSPDSKKIVFSDKDLRLYCIDVAAKKTTQIDKAERNEIHDYSWTADSRYLAYYKGLPNEIGAIFIYSFDDGVIHQVTPGLTDDFAPCFDPDGKYLYFLSQRNFNPILSSYEFDFTNRAITDLYLILLQKDEKSPFLPGSDEAGAKDDKDADMHKDGRPGPPEPGKGKDPGSMEPGKKEGDEKKDKAPVKVKIDFDGIYDREVAFDLPAGEYGGVSAISGAVFYTSAPLSGLMGKINEDESSLHKYDIKEKKDAEWAQGVNNYVLSANREKMLISKHNEYSIVDVAGSGPGAGPRPGMGGGKPGADDSRLDLSHMEMKLDRRAEYAQMFDEIWRLDRDFFYDKNMHGVDWPKMKERYRALLPYVANRFDLTYIAGEMMGELCCSHTYVGGGGDRGGGPGREGPPAGNIGLLGCDFAVDKQNNRIKIARILKGENWDESLRSPLRDPDIDVKEGDYLLAINGKEVTGDIDPYTLTANTLGQTIALTVNSKPTMAGAHDVTVKPIAEEESLRYYTWVENNRHYVDSVSGGKIGYIHIPDMGGPGLVRFMKMFYNQIHKEGLIIDVRYNGGGFVSRLVLDRLSRKVTGVNFSRNFASGFDPGDAVNAHMITLVNQFSTSDGDNFPYFFRLLGLGPVMGKRTWGGVVGIRGFRPLADGGYATVSEFTTYSLDSKWIMENHGVDPDIEVDNLPDRAAKGYDDQLDKAIEYIAKQVKEQPVVLPPYPGPPAKR